MRSAEEIFARFESRTNLERTTPQLRMYRLERMVALLERLGNPQTTLPVVHLAGSKGKGSTAAYTASVLAASGLTVGLYTSPHVRSYRERFLIIPQNSFVGADEPEGEPTPPEDGPGLPATQRSDAAVRPEPVVTPPHERALLTQGTRVWAEVEAMMAEGTPEDELPTTFELLTALAFCYFPAAGCDWIVLETGLGGRLDATNVCRPALTMITRIEIEHTEYLGTTRREIAGEKAGIIKPAVPVMLAPQHPEADAVFRTVAAERNAPLRDVMPLPAAPASEPPPRKGSAVAVAEAVYLPPWTGGSVVSPAMLGEVQRVNIAMALAGYRELVDAGAVPMADTAAIHAAIAGTRLPGRGERIGDLILDGAHTEESALQLAATMKTLLPDGARVPVILGIVAGKNVEAITAALAPIALVFIVSRPGRFKPGDPLEVARRAVTAEREIVIEEEPSAALERARSLRPAGLRHPILVTGSFYMVAEIRRLVVP
jgi:dihydrofolate synthase/folylpolyglutamate synthase